MKLLQETTVWDTPNHIYVVTDDKWYAYGYYKYDKESGTFAKQVEMFKKPLRFYVKNRTFKVLAEGFQLK